MELGAQGEAARNSRRSPWTGSVPEAGKWGDSNTCTVSSPLPPITTPAVGRSQRSQIYSQVNTPSKLRIHPLLPRLFLSHLVSLTKASSPIFKGGEKKRELSLVLLPRKLAFPSSTFLNPDFKEVHPCSTVFPSSSPFSSLMPARRLSGPTVPQKLL